MKRGHWPWALAAAGLAWFGWRRRRGAALDGEVALVTGGSRGLGFLLAERLLDAGCRVIICARDEQTLRRAHSRLASRGDIDSIACDVSDARDVADLVDHIMQRHGRIDILINNAATIRVGPLETFSLDDFHDAMNAAFWGTVHTTLAVLPHMRRRRAGRIANITSIGGRVAVPHLLPYDCAKFAAVGFSQGLRAELAGSGIAVTTVIPGLMRTGSPLHVQYRGQPRREYAWFSLGDLLPLTAMSAQRAADRIILAVRRAEPVLTLSWQARLLSTLHDLAPATTQRLLGLAGRALPEPDGDLAAARPGAADAARGTELLGTLPAPVRKALITAADRTNQR